MAGKMTFANLIKCINLMMLVFTGVFIYILYVFSTHLMSKVFNSQLELSVDHLEDLCDCEKILAGDREAVERAKLVTITKNFRNETRVPDEHYTKWTRNCGRFRVTRKYVTFPLSQEEEQYPIAYSIVIHHKAQTFERLLRSVYAPQNFYCIHIDKKSPASFQAAVTGIASCFDNVIVSSQLETVVYASWSRLQADINCMRDLYNMGTTWKYFINLCGQDFPIKTNLEIVKKLKGLHGKNSLETEKMPQYKEYRWRKQYNVVNDEIVMTDINKSLPPVNTPVFAGGAYIVVSRDFVRYVLEDPAAQKLIDWAKDTYIPEELLWATLQRQPSVPGFIPSNSRYDVTDVNAISRLVKWEPFEGQESNGAMYPPCAGHHIRTVCVYGVGDLNWMLQQHHLFANKFDSDSDYIALYCLEKHLRHKALTAST